MKMTIENKTRTPSTINITSVAKYVVRSWRIFPIPGWKVETIEFTNEEMKEQFDSLNADIKTLEKNASISQQEIDKLSSQYKRVNRLLEQTKNELKRATKEAKRAVQVERELRSTQRSLETTRKELRRSDSNVATLRRQGVELKASKTRVDLQLTALQARHKGETKKWADQKKEREAQIALLGRDLDQAQKRNHQLKVAFSLLPLMSEIPYGQNSLSQKTGLGFSQQEREISHPAMYTEPQSYERPSLNTPLGVVRSLCLSKERTNVSKSQDACAFEYRNGRLFIGVADGVSTSHRQSEWAHRCVRSVLADNPYHAYKQQQKSHEGNAATFLELEPESTRWMAQAATGRKSDATLMRIDAGRDKVVLQRRGDVWAAAWNASSKEWRVVLSPSSEDGTMAVSSDEALEFTDELTITKPSRLLLMTDGLNPTDQVGFNLLWEKMNEEDPNEFEAWLQKALAGTTFAEDDVTVVAVDFTKEEG
jgi:hypothetical protein